MRRRTFLLGSLAALAGAAGAIAAADTAQALTPPSAVPENAAVSADDLDRVRTENAQYYRRQARRIYRRSYRGRRRLYRRVRRRY